jgi:hypothetical protein
MQQAPPVLVFYYIRRLFPYHFSINYNIIRFKHTAQGKCSQENTMPGYDTSHESNEPENVKIVYHKKINI